MPKGHASEDVQKAIRVGAGWSSELRKGLWVCKTFFTLLDSMTVKGVSERID